MSELLITCDRTKTHCRAAVWAGRALQDLYVDRLDAPDFSGALVRGKVLRVLKGGKAGWIDGGLSAHIYCETPHGLKAGEKKTVRIQTTMGHGKAWVGQVVESGAPGEGLLEPPPMPWQRALAAIGLKKNAALHLESGEDRLLFERAYGASKRLRLLTSKERAHPDLDETLDALSLKTVALPGGASLVIEQTEALVAIDVNAFDHANPTAVNLLAVREAARQIRLRQLAGIIVIDALKMKNRADKAKVQNALTRAAETDPAGVHVFGFTKLGLIELTRTRCGSSLADVME